MLHNYLVFERIRLFRMTAFLKVFTITLCITIGGWLNVFAQSLTDTAALFRIISKARTEELIRSKLRPLMAKKKIDPIIINARLSTQVPVMADTIASMLTFNPDIQRIKDGDELWLKKQLRPENQKKWENTINEFAGKLVTDYPNMWGNLLARDFSDRVIVFHSEIKVLPSARLDVMETIVIYNGNGEKSPDIDYSINYDPNNDIQRGIVRDFPTKYLAKDGFWQKVGFTLKRVTRNGKTSNYNTESLDNGVRIMVGDADIIIEPGLHTYQFHYETDQQIIYHENKDELYWNVNGTGWVFFADSVSSTVHFPSGGNIIENACYTGVQGSTEKFCTSKLWNDSTIHFYTTTRLEAWQGLTIAAAIPKGILAAGPVRDWKKIATDNIGISVLAGTFAGLFLFYFLAWYFKGRDPKKGTIIPQFEPPADLSPADVGYISTQIYGSHLFAAALVDMAVKKYLKIDVETKKFVFKWTSYHFGQPASIGRGDGNHLSKLYGFTPQSMYGQTAEKGKYNASLKSNYDALKTTLEDRFKIRNGKKNTWHGMFVRNDGFTGFGGFIAFAALVFGVIYVINQYTLNMLAVIGFLVLGILTIHGIFVKIMSAYTPKGRETADHIEGFKMYLETAEQKLYQYFTPPEKSLELFEKYLPYAIALQVENAWADKFDDLMQKAIEGGYEPTYYSGSGSSLGRNFSMGAMTSSLSAGLSSSTASASTPPSSSSGGSSGGGSSGGGGGGGGGGGW